MSSEPSEEDVKLSHQTADAISGIIQMGFDINHNIPPMPPYPAIPIKKLTKLIEDSEAFMFQVINTAKQLKRHAEKKGIELGPLVSALASIDVPEVRLKY